MCVYDVGKLGCEMNNSPLGGAGGALFGVSSADGVRSLMLSSMLFAFSQRLLFSGGI